MKNEEAELPIVLHSARPFVDEIVIYDTGSTDRSVPVARSLGATVIEGYWDHDFSRARNAALDHCSGEWILWLDADESLHGDAGAFRQRLGRDREFATYLLPIESIEGNGLAAHTVFRAARVFRRSTCHWHGPIHEQIGLRDGDGVPPTTLGVELRILHRGYTKIKSDAKDLIQRNLTIARAALEDPDVDRSRALFDFGRTLTQTDEREEGIARLREAIALTDIPTIRRGALRTIFYTQLGMESFDDAEETLEELRAASRTSVATDTLRARLLLAREEYQRCIDVVDRLPFVDTDEDGMEYGRNSVAQVKARALTALGRPGEAADALLEALRTHGQLDGDLAALVRLLLAAERSPAEVVAVARPETMPVLVAMASHLPALHADEVLAAFVERYPGRLEPLAASAKIVGLLPVARVMWWSSRLRQVGLEANCPLVAMAADEDNEPQQRLMAAAGGYLLFRDQRLVEPARAAFAQLPPSARDDARAAVAGISPPLAGLLETTTVAVRLGDPARPTEGYATFPDGERLPLQAGSVHELAAGDALAGFSRDQAGAVLAEWARVLAAGGHCRLEVPDLDAVGTLVEAGDLAGARRLLFGEHPEHTPRRDAWTRQELQHWLPRVGFEVESIESVAGAPLLRVSMRRRPLAVRSAGGPSAPAVSVIVVAHHGRQALLEQLRALSSTPAGADFETVVMVNGPDPAAVALLDALDGDVTVAHSTENLDWGAALDEAARLARGETVVVLSGTTALRDGWLSDLLAPFADPSVGLVGACLVDSQGLVRHAGYELAATSNVDERMMAVARHAYLQADDHRLQGDGEVDALGPECFAMRAEVWHELRGVAPGWAPAEAVIDLGLRLRQHQLRTVVAGRCTVEAASRGDDGESGDRLARHWAGRVPLKPAPAKATSASSLMPTTSLIERLAGDLPIRATPLGGGVNLVGAFARSRVRAYAGGLDAAGFMVSRLEWDWGAPVPLDGEPLPYVATVLAIEGDHLTDYYGEVGIDSLRSRHTVLAWDWPLDVAGPDVAATSSMVNEIWVPSAFSEQAVANVSARPVFRVPPPVAAGIADAGVEPDTGALSFLTVARPAWGRRRDLAMANPSGAIDAFCAAFGNGSGPTLRVVLTGGRTQAEAERCREVIGGRRDINVVETDDEELIGQFLAEAHAYLSLHRSSAFGLDLAHALANGRPVIATGYGGPMDYLREDNAELVGFALTALDDALVREVPGARWAEPDIDEAAAALRRVVHDYRSACQRAWSGRSLVTRRFSRKTAAKVLERRLGFVAAETFRGKTRRSQK